MRESRLDAREPDQFGVRAYQILCLAALVVITMSLLRGSLGGWALMPMLIGALTIVTNWRSGPFVWLLVLVLLATARSRGFDPSDMMYYILGAGYLARRMLFIHTPSLFADLIFVSSSLVYLIAQMRLLSMTQQVLPTDPRETSPWWGVSRDDRNKSQAAQLRKRGSDSTNSRELVVVMLLAGFCPLLSAICWFVLKVFAVPRLWSRGERPVLLLVWVFSLAVIAAYTVFAYVRRAQATEEESRCYLQDQLWRETRWELARMGRWMVWKRLREQKRQEKRKGK